MHLAASGPTAAAPSVREIKALHAKARPLIQPPRTPGLGAFTWHDICAVNWQPACIGSGENIPTQLARPRWSSVGIPDGNQNDRPAGKKQSINPSDQRREILA